MVGDAGGSTGDRRGSRLRRRGEGWGWAALPRHVDFEPSFDRDPQRVFEEYDDGEYKSCPVRRDGKFAGSRTQEALGFGSGRKVVQRSAGSKTHMDAEAGHDKFGTAEFERMVEELNDFAKFVRRIRSTRQPRQDPMITRILPHAAHERDPSARSGWRGHPSPPPVLPSSRSRTA